MDPPSIPIPIPIPVGGHYNPLGYSLVTILWWVGIWGLSETILTLFFKESLIFKLGFYLLLISIVFLLLLVDPQTVNHL